MSITEIQTTIGFTWDSGILPEVKSTDILRAVRMYKQQHAMFVWDAAKLENNPLTYIDVQTLLSGITIGGHKLSDTEQITNLSDSGKALTQLVAADKFDLDKSTFLYLHGIVARNEAIEWGVFRGEGEEKNYTPYVGLGEKGFHRPLPTSDGAPALNAQFEKGIECIKTLPAYEGAMIFFLFGAFHQFFFDGNKRTSRHMMNGWLMKHGFDPITIPASHARQFNQLMIDFYLTKEGTEMLFFLTTCRNLMLN